MDTQPVVVQESDATTETWSDPVRGEASFRTLFGGEGSPTDTLTAGVAELAPGGWLGCHRHDPPETYFVMQGEGVVQLGDEERGVRAGSAVFVPSSVEHGIRNTGQTSLRIFYAFAVDSFDEVEYHFTEA
jgi:mannose-6-phosphate isomerase-like protein (cupin superfamily)